LFLSAIAASFSTLIAPKATSQARDVIWAGITRKTLHRVEQGEPAVAPGIYARVLQALRLEDELATIALDDVPGRKLQDANPGPNRRAPRRSPATDFASEVPAPQAVPEDSGGLR
jgi:hypothetical protein